MKHEDHFMDTSSRLVAAQNLKLIGEIFISSPSVITSTPALLTDSLNLLKKIAITDNTLTGSGQAIQFTEEATTGLLTFADAIYRSELGSNAHSTKTDLRQAIHNVLKSVIAKEVPGTPTSTYTFSSGDPTNGIRATVTKPDQSALAADLPISVGSTTFTMPSSNNQCKGRQCQIKVLVMPGEPYNTNSSSLNSVIQSPVVSVEIEETSPLQSPDSELVASTVLSLTNLSPPVMVQVPLTGTHDP